MNSRKTITLVIVVAAIVGSIAYLNSTKVERAGSGALDAVSIVPRCEAAGNCRQAGEEEISALPSTETILPQKSSAPLPDKSKMYALAKEITTPDHFINTGGLPVTIQGLIGKKVILIDFWTYSCINCQRTQPYLNAWYDKYADEGLEIIGMHTPEFDFEKELTNVLKAVADANIKYPVVMDNDFSTWGAYGNRFWPRKYLIDIDGYIVYDHIGEGAYQETETRIQELLRERKTVLKEEGAVTADVVDVAPVARTFALSPETYFGAWRNTNLGNGKQGIVGTTSFADPGVYTVNTLYLGGDWNIATQYAENVAAQASIKFTYRGKEVFFVGSSDESVTVRVLLDGKPLPASMRGADVSSDGRLIIDDERLYTIIKGDVYGEHLLELLIEKPGLKAFTFTFG